jgi:AraC-like DNA-binding protein
MRPAVDLQSTVVTPLVGGGNVSFAWTDAFGGFGCAIGTTMWTAYPAHVHATAVITLVEGGCVVLRTGAADHRVAEGSLILLSPHQVHSERWHDGAFTTFFLPPRALVAAGAGTAVGCFQATRAPVVVHPALGHQVRRVRDLILSDAPATRVEAATVDLLRGAGDARLHGPPSVAPGWEPVTIIRDRLHADLARAPTIQSLAQMTGRSPFHMIRAFRAAVGLPPRAYWEQVRIAEAKEMLVNGRSLAHVTFSLGFCDQSHFTRHFARTVRMTPGRYAAMVRAGAR